MPQTLKEVLDKASTGGLTPDQQRSLKVEISSGIYDELASAEGIDLSRIKASALVGAGAGAKTELAAPTVGAHEGSQLEVQGKKGLESLPEELQQGIKEERRGVLGDVVAGAKEGMEGAVEKEQATREAFQAGEIGTGTALAENLGNAINRMFSPVTGAIMEVAEPVIDPVVEFATKKVGETLTEFEELGEKASVEAFGEKRTEKAKAKIAEQFNEAVAPMATFYESLEEDTKRHLGIFGESANNLLMLFGAGTLGSEVKGAMALAKKGITSAKESVAAAKIAKTQAKRAQLSTTIDTTIEKAVRPSVAAVKSAGGTDKYMEKARGAVEAIVENKSELAMLDEFGEAIELPETLKQFADSIPKAKNNIYGKYNALSKEAGEAGAEISLENTVKELAQVADDSVLTDLNPEVVKYVNSRISTLSERGVYTPDQTEEALKILNESLSAYYRSPSSESYSKAAVDAMIANNMRKQMDEVINAATGAEYQALRSQYAAIKAIEKDVMHRAVVHGRKNEKGLIDFSDIFSAGEVIAGITSAQPALVAKGVGQHFVKNWYKKINDPDRAIRKMFKEADEVLDFKSGVIPQTKDFITEAKAANNTTDSK